VWDFSIVNSEDQAVRHAAALAVCVAETTKVLIIATSISMCHELGSNIQKYFQG
jgi:hypothetical protein